MKATFKPVVFTALITIATFCGVFYMSCKQDKCKAIACAYGGACNDGVCKCMPGYEGTNCETVTASKFAGFWYVAETGTITNHRQYPLDIIADTNATTVWIQNCYNYFPSIRATVQGDTITIPNQQLLGKVIFGKGYLVYPSDPSNPNLPITLTMLYEVIDSVNQNMVDDFGVNAVLDHSQASVWTKN